MVKSEAEEAGICGQLPELAAAALSTTSRATTVEERSTTPLLLSSVVGALGSIRWCCCERMDVGVFPKRVKRVDEVEVRGERT